MKTFSELLATDFHLEIVIDGEKSIQPLLDPVDITIIGGYKTVIIDDFEIKDWMGEIIDGGWKFHCDNFYQWKHKITNQGWLFYQNTKK